MLCGKAPKFGSGISLSGELVLEFYYFKKFQDFECFNPVGSRQKKLKIICQIVFKILSTKMKSEQKMF